MSKTMEQGCRHAIRCHGCKLYYCADSDGEFCYICIHDSDGFLCRKCWAYGESWLRPCKSHKHAMRRKKIEAIDQRRAAYFTCDICNRGSLGKVFVKVKLPVIGTLLKVRKYWEEDTDVTYRDGRACLNCCIKHKLVGSGYKRLSGEYEF